jgi:hypothetical protein
MKSILWVLSITYTICSSEVIFALTINRHGMRSPGKLLSYLHHEKDFTRKEMLTEEGYLQMFNVGAILKGIYSDKIISPNYDESEIYIRCSSKLRTYDSALMMARGLHSEMFDNQHSDESKMNFSDSTLNIIKDAHITREHPIHMHDSLTDSLLKPYKHQVCSNKDAIVKKFRSEEKASEKRYNISSELKDTLHNITGFTDVDKLVSSIGGIQIALRHGKIDSSRLSNKNLEEMNELEFKSKGWLTRDNGYLSKQISITFLKSLELYIHYAIQKDKGIKECAKTLRSIAQYDAELNDFLDSYNSTCNLSYVVLSAHDYTIVEVLTSLEVSLYSKPDFGSVVRFEIEKGPEYSIRVYYNDNELKLSFCDSTCTVSEFGAYIKKIVASDICKPGKDSSFIWRMWLVMVVIGGAIIAVVKYSSYKPSM